MSDGKLNMGNDAVIYEGNEIQQIRYADMEHQAYKTLKDFFFPKRKSTYVLIYLDPTDFSYPCLDFFF